LRFARLGELPLADSEAHLALDALDIVKGGSPVLSSHIAYTNLTAILFFVFGSFNFLARFIPALAGTALVFVPFLFRDWLKPRAAILLAFFFAMDPALVALSRQAGSPILAVTFSLLAAGFWIRRQPRPAGIFLALALLSGPSLWAGLLGILLTWMLTQFMAPRSAPVEADEGTQVDTEESTHVDTYTGTQVDVVSELPNFHPLTPNSHLLTPNSQPLTPNSQSAPLITDYRSLITAFIITLFATSTLLLLAPQGLGAWLTSLPEYFKGWVTFGAVPVGRLFLALGVYQLLGVILALIAIMRGWMRAGRRVIRLSLWMLVALLLTVFYPARQTADLVWMLIPLWTLAALELSRHLELVREDRLETAGVFIFTVILLVFAWMDLNALSLTPIPSQQASIRIFLFFGSLLLLVLSVILVGYGWSERIARVGAAWGVTLIFGIYTLGAAWGATGLRNPNAVELWNSSPRIAQADLLSQTADEISEWATGQADDLPVTVFGIDSPALLWSLRNHNPKMVIALDPASSPELIVTPPQDSLGLASAYRGQDFNWRQTPFWESFASFSLRWLTYRELPSSSETVVLWVRSDLFIDSEQP
jgi:MFS family permease